jgi:hypothetical protein
MAQLERHGHAEELYDVLHRIVGDNPDLPLWTFFEHAPQWRAIAHLR